MKKIIAILLALVLALSLSTPASAITPGVWGETNYGYTQPVEPTEPPTEAPEELPEEPAECCWLGWLWLWRWLEWMKNVQG